MKANIILIIAGALLFESCKKFLIVNPETNVSQATFYITQSDFQQAVNAVYEPLQSIFDEDWQLTELRSDNTFFTFDIGNRGTKPIEDLATFTIETGNPIVRRAWLNYFLMISRANNVLARIEEATFDQALKDQMTGEALFLRSLAYFQLVKKFGDVPLFLTPPTTYAETFQPRVPKSEIYDQIISDVSNAATLLPSRADQPTPGRATSGASYMLLADIYITLKRWADAESAARQVLNMGYGLVQNYADIFDPSNKANNELIFQINYMEGTTQELYSTFPYKFLPELADPSVITGVSPGSRDIESSFNVPTPDLMSDYEDISQDTRYAASDDFFTGPSPLVGITYNDMPYIKKYLYPHAISGQTNMNWPLYRYAEILLIIAESVNEQDRSSEALPFLNQVRTRAQLDPVSNTNKDQLREIILHERRIELAFENKRWDDLVRTERAVTALNDFGAKVKAQPQEYYYPAGSSPASNAFVLTANSLLLPIPIYEVLTNPEIIQNEGY